MGHITTLGTIIDAAAQGPGTAQEIYRRGKYCTAEPRRSCSMIMRIGRRFAIRGKDIAEEVQEAQSL